ncbi:hypothetical protein Glove_65g143 [Diversispora epigaea]|uniref:Uncharacterized protein n=1 Tax=Diversispora epigaea TaxID=1348612 RepID=A0A397JB00_9GLOM|nr:hypothetical protein Glove_65g143 [Diversispora epigaea]
MEDEPLIQQDVLREIVNRAIDASTNIYSNDLIAQNKLLKISIQFNDAFEGVRSVNDIKRTKLEKYLSRQEITVNIELQEGMDQISELDLTWRDPLASKVISDKSDLVQNLSGGAKKSFMKPSHKMRVQIPFIIRDMCATFVENFRDDNIEALPQHLYHDNTWKESNETLANVTEDIFDSLRDIWRNPAFDTEFVNVQSEGTYVTDIVVPLIRASLRKLPTKKNGFLSTAERQSLASADRRGKGKQGKRPDVMFMEKHREKLYELMFVECSRIICTERKKDDDKMKLWREMNDGLYYVHRSCRPDKNEFGILGVQIAGSMMYLNILIKDSYDIHRLFHLCSVEIPIQPSSGEDVLQFVEALLLLRNIMIVNISLLFHSSETRSERLKRQKALPQHLYHDNTWKESNETLANVTEDIFDSLRDIWRNPAFDTEFVNVQSEGTYVTDIVVPLIRASLRKLPTKKNGFLSTAERQSLASADRRGKGKQGKRPDVMFMEKHREKLYELMFVECSRIICTERKKDDDKMKLWREMNDGLYYVHRSCRPDKNEFGILGVQIAGSMMYLNILIKDSYDIHRLFHLCSVEIPIQPSSGEDVLQFVEALLLLRNIMIVNISLLFHSSETRSERLKRQRSMMYLNILIKDSYDIHRLFHLCSVEIPIRPSSGEDVLQFVEALLLLRNIMIVNISLLFHSSETRSERLKRQSSSSTISSPNEGY